jgi:hypothetical protein
VEGSPEFGVLTHAVGVATDVHDVAAVQDLAPFRGLRSRLQEGKKRRGDVLYKRLRASST